MSDSLSKIVAIVLAALLLFIFPMKNEFERLDQTSRIYVFSETTKFVDSVRNLGYITPTMYEQFRNRLAITNNRYEIKLEHYKAKYDPVYDAPLNPATFHNDYNINLEGFYNDEIMKCLFPTPPVSTARYGMAKGDYFGITVVNKNKTLATKIQELLFNADMKVECIFVKYGGMIRDENN
ncbi:MAG: hypothetical protein N2376_06820 [Clostridia bacterium]|nr:hypothetical protein [Clostridia bacterium]